MSEQVHDIADAPSEETESRFDTKKIGAVAVATLVVVAGAALFNRLRKRSTEVILDEEKPSDEMNSAEA